MLYGTAHHHFHFASGHCYNRETVMTNFLAQFTLNSLELAINYIHDAYVDAIPYQGMEC